MSKIYCRVRYDLKYDGSFCNGLHGAGTCTFFSDDEFILEDLRRLLADHLRVPFNDILFISLLPFSEEDFKAYAGPKFNLQYHSD